MALAQRRSLFQVEAGPFNNIHQQLLTPGDALEQAAHVVILARIDDLTLADDWSVSGALALVDDLIGALTSFTHRSGARVWIGLFPPSIPRRFHDARQSGRLAGSLRANATLLEFAESNPSVWCVDIAGALAELGRAAYDSKRDMLARLPFSETGLEAISLELARSIAASLRTPRKVLALDCDGVLWGGVVGEDGVEGVKIGEDPIGRAHKNLQRFVRSLKARGLFLALCSKNNEEDVHSVFDDREEMELSLEDVAVETINWDPKSQNLRRISKALNVGVDSIVFLDDDPAEIAEVRAHLPEVATLLLPKDISQAVEFLANQECFDRNAITDEDLGRTAMIRAEKSRAIATNSPEGQPNLEDFLAELELVATVHTCDPRTFERVLQLLQKTNQFNLTTRRHEAAAFNALLSQPDWCCHTLSLKDRFGQYGLTAVAIAGPAESDELLIDSFLLSCRILGRGVEQGLLAVLVDQARELRLTKIRAEFVVTERNRPAADFLRTHFQCLSSADYVLNVDSKAPRWPAHIRIERE